MPRSFIAIDSNQKTRKSLTGIQEKLKKTEGDLKIVEPENIHMTLRFLGNVSESRLEDIKNILKDSATVDPFEMNVEGLGVFPKPSFIRVVWAGVSEGTEETKAIRGNLDRKLEKIGISPSDKDFTPHFTIARIKSGKAKEKIYSVVEENSDKPFGTISVEEIKLMKSELTPEGPIYSTLEKAKL